MTRYSRLTTLSMAIFSEMKRIRLVTFLTPSILSSLISVTTVLASSSAVPTISSVVSVKLVLHFTFLEKGYLSVFKVKTTNECVRTVTYGGLFNVVK